MNTNQNTSGTTNCCSMLSIGHHEVQQSKTDDASAATRFLVRELAAKGDELIYWRAEFDFMRRDRNESIDRLNDVLRKLRERPTPGKQIGISLNFQVDDMIVTPGFKCPRTYTIIGIYLGAIGQDSVIEMIPSNASDPSDGSVTIKSLFIPVEMLTAGIVAGTYEYLTKGGLNSTSESYPGAVVDANL